jgi:phage anti-repressor protein
MSAHPNQGIISSSAHSNQDIMSPSTQNEINVLFLAMAESKTRSGFLISLYDTLMWTGVLNKCQTQVEKNKKARGRRNYHFKCKTVTTNGKESIVSESDIFEYGIDFIISNRNDNSLTRPTKDVFMTDATFKHFCMMQKTPISKMVRKYYIQLEHDYITALDASEKENKKMLEEIRKNSKKLTQHDNDIFWKNKVLNLKDRVNKLECNSYVQNLKISEQLEKIKNIEGGRWCTTINESVLIRYFLQKHAKPVCLYLVNPIYAEKKTRTNKAKKNKIELDDCSSYDVYQCDDLYAGADDEVLSDDHAKTPLGISLDYEFLDICNMENHFGKTFYFSTVFNAKEKKQNENYKFLEVLHVLTKTGYTEIINSFESEKIKRGIYALTYEDVKNAFEQHIIKCVDDQYKTISV